MSPSEKEKFIEMLIDDHSLKKNKYFDLIGTLIDHDSKLIDSEKIKDDINKDLC